jgi:hypothetical protein
MPSRSCWAFRFVSKVSSGSKTALTGAGESAQLSIQRMSIPSGFRIPPRYYKFVRSKCSRASVFAASVRASAMLTPAFTRSMTPAAAYQTLMKRARGMADRVAKSGTGPRLTVEQCFVKVLTDPTKVELAKLSMKAGSAPLPVREALSPAYEKLMSMVKRAADRDPSRTIHQHFACWPRTPLTVRCSRPLRLRPSRARQTEWQH